jgi:hypothetical protein
MPRKRKERRSLDSWLTVFFAAAGLAITLWTTMTDRHDTKRQRAIASIAQLTAAEAKVNQVLRLQVKMERQLKQCLDRATDSEQCWTANYDFDPEAAMTAWNEFDVAVVSARSEALTKREVETVSRLEAIRRQYRVDLPRLLEATDTSRAAERILRTAADLDAALDDFKGAVLARIT